MAPKRNDANRIHNTHGCLSLPYSLPKESSQNKRRLTGFPLLNVFIPEAQISSALARGETDLQLGELSRSFLQGVMSSSPHSHYQAPAKHKPAAPSPTTNTPPDTNPTDVEDRLVFFHMQRHLQKRILHTWLFFIQHWFHQASDMLFLQCTTRDRR